MQFLTFVISTIIQLYITILLLYVWMHLVKIDLYNPFFQFITKFIQPVIKKLHFLTPYIITINTATLLVAYILTIINIVFVVWTTNTINLISLKLFPISFIQLLTYAGKLVFWLILIRTIFSWINKNFNIMSYMFIQLTEPLLLPIRKIIPTISNLDPSTIIAMLILIALNRLRLDIMLSIDQTITKILLI